MVLASNFQLDTSAHNRVHQGLYRTEDPKVLFGQIPQGRGIQLHRPGYPIQGWDSYYC